MTSEAEKRLRGLVRSTLNDVTRAVDRGDYTSARLLLNEADRRIGEAWAEALREHPAPRKR